MPDINITELDEVYTRYGYEPRTIKNIRVYHFTKSIYNGVDIINLKSNEDIVENIKIEYAKLGYAIKVRSYNTILDAEDALFKDFFKAEGVTANLTRRYSYFVSKMMDQLPENAEYKYITSAFDYTIYDNDSNDGKIIQFSADDQKNAIVNKVVNLINEHNGPLLIIIEAAAGYGKTCTAYEVLNEFIKLSSNKLPFFTELSRDRKAAIFKHILQFEIEDQFSNRVDSNTVIHQITSGRIPLIIDGFDELISKDFSFSSNQFEQVESMLSTIIDLLTNNAKIVITSRKTAIFNSEDFHNWMIDRNINYTLAKATIAEPLIENWLDAERLQIIKTEGLPVDQISNPVLLTFLRYINIEELKKLVSENRSIVDKYFEFLLNREQVRQNLLIEPDHQLVIFRDLVRLFTEWDIKSETKDFVKEMILDYNKDLLEETRRKYTPDRRPRVDQLADILANHAFLDRKDKGQIGFVNEFVLGTLIAENFITGIYQSYFVDFQNKISQTFALLAVQAFKVQPLENKYKLWEVFNSHCFPYDQQFYFKIDLEFRGKLDRTYQMATIEGFDLLNIAFVKDAQFDTTVFNSCVFINCSFSFTAFKKTSFINCRFYNCALISNGIGFSEDYFSMYGCTDDNDFIESIYSMESSKNDEFVSLEKEILDLFFKKGSLKPRHRQLSYIKEELHAFDSKSISRTIQKLKNDDIIQFNGDLSHLTKAGINYYNEKYRTA